MYYFVVRTSHEQLVITYFNILAVVISLSNFNIFYLKNY